MAENNCGAFIPCENDQDDDPIAGDILNDYILPAHHDGGGGLGDILRQGLAKKEVTLQDFVTRLAEALEDEINIFGPDDCMLPEDVHKCFEGALIKSLAEIITILPEKGSASASSRQ